jgi:excisionase family DNA binding protein
MNGNSSPPFEEFVSVREAAALLRVSESTVWRWLNEDRVPSYRVGPKRVLLKRADLTPRPRHSRREARGLSEADRKRLNAFPMSPRTPGVDPVALARALHAKQRAKPGWGSGPEAWEDINEARDERSRELD